MREYAEEIRKFLRRGQVKIESKSQLFALRLKGIRLRDGLNQAEFAAKAGVSKKTIENWEKGAHEPGGKRLRRLCENLGVTPAHFHDAPAVDGEPMNDEAAPYGDRARMRDALASIRQQAESLAAQVRDWEARFGFSSNPADPVDAWVRESRAGIENDATAPVPPSVAAQPGPRTGPESAREPGVSHHGGGHKNGSSP